QRAHDGIDPFVPLETRNGQQPRPTVQSVLRPNGPRIDSRVEVRGRGAERYRVNRNVEIEQLEHSLRELGSPPADRDDNGSMAEHAPRGPLLEAAAPNFRLDQEQLGAVHDQTVGNTMPRREPARRISRGLQLRAPREARPPGLRERARAPGPQ